MDFESCMEEGSFGNVSIITRQFFKLKLILISVLSKGGPQLVRVEIWDKDEDKEDDFV